jgi:hypothetical protein
MAGTRSNFKIITKRVRAIPGVKRQLAWHVSKFIAGGKALIISKRRSN